MKEQIERSAVEEKDKWDLTPIYPNDEAWYSDLEKAKEEIKKVSNYTNLLDNASNLLEYITYDVKTERLLYRLYYYAHLNSDADTTDTGYQKMFKLINDVINEYNELGSYITPLFMETDYSVIEKYYEEEPNLKKYEFNIQKIYRYQKHTLSKEQEKMLSILSNCFSNPENTYDSLTDADLTFGRIVDEEGNEVELTDSNYSKYISSKNRQVRKDAFDLMYKTYSSYKNTITSTYNGDIDTNIALAKIRNYNSAREASLFADNVTTDIYDNLIDTVSKNLNVLYKYYDLKKEILKLDELHLYDIYADLIKVETDTYEFEDAKDLVLKSLSILGNEYTDTLKKAFNERWIDIYNNKGKRSGAYSSGFYDTNPYILLNYEKQLRDVSTLAHELGHSMHTYYSCQNNPYQYSSYSIFVAEVASTVNELLLNKYMLKNSNKKEEKLYILNRLMELFKGTIFRQTMFAEFERDMYEKRENKEALTNDILCDVYYELNKKYFGPNVVVDEEIKYEWERIPHFYYGFYVYKYATGLSAACYIVDGILSGKKNALENYLAFLKTGGSMYPVDELKVAGVDISNPKVIESAIHMFDEIIEEFKNLINE